MAAVEGLTQKQLAELAGVYEKLQTKLQIVRTNAARLAAQQSESQSVQKELANLEEDAILYKLVGPVLVRQTIVDSRQTVQKRLAFIDGELKKAEASAINVTNEIEDVKQKVMAVQKVMMAKSS